MSRALIIDIEGTDGSSKTTSQKYLVEKLRELNFKILETREVGAAYIPACVKLREFVLDPSNNLDGTTMELIFAAMRIENQKYYDAVKDEYDFIISDRGWFSHLSYTDHNVNPKFTEDFYVSFLKQYTYLPDAVVYLNVDTDVALKRRIKRGSGTDVIEMKGVEFQEKVRDSFLKYLATHDSVNQYFVDANQNIEGVQKQLDNVIARIASSRDLVGLVGEL